IEADAGRANQEAHTTLALSYQAAQQLVQLYMDQVFYLRHQRQAQFDLGLGCRLGPAALQDDTTRVLGPACNSLRLPVPWSAIEPTEGDFDWELQDQLREWATEQEVPVTAGPLVDFSSAQLPDWLWLWERDLGSLAKFMCEYVMAAVKRYRQRIRRWQLTAAS